MKHLKSSSSPGLDGITAFHLKAALDTNLMTNLCTMFNICIVYGVIPASFTQGLLIPILKKNTLDPSIPNNYRPITISNTFSKICELLILNETSCYKFSDSQFGFIAGRSTGMATALAHDVFSYCNANGSTVYSCSLDAEGAFDAIPHAILFNKAIGVLPDYCWRMLLFWYKRLNVHVKWNGHLSDPIAVLKGTRQGGLSSPFLFNLFYKDLIDDLNSSTMGISINNKHLNVICYADDILLVSLTVTGLQKLINVTSNNVESNGLRFNPSKSQCMVVGKQCLPFPEWHINSTCLKIYKSIQYLGTTLSNNNNRLHVDSRIKSCRRAFYSLQGAGLCTKGITPFTKAYLWNSAIRPILLYGNNCIHLNKSNTNELNKIQSSLIKAALNLPKTCKSSPLLNALQISKISVSVDLSVLDLVVNMFNNSQCRNFYYNIMSRYVSGNFQGNKNIIYRACDVCERNNLSFLQFIYSPDYRRKNRKFIYSFPKQDGVVDSIRMELSNTVPNFNIVRLLLSAF